MMADIVRRSRRHGANDNALFCEESWHSKDNCYVYLISADAVFGVDESKSGIVKVGISSNPHGRLSGIQTSTPFKIRLVGCWRMISRTDALWVEKRFHWRQRRQRIHGEWFKFDIAPAEWHVAMTVVEWYVEHAVGNFGGSVEFLKFAGMQEKTAQEYLREAYGDIGEQP